MLVLFIGKTASSQDANKERAIALTASKMHVVYAALENPLTIVAPGIPSDKIKVSCDKGTIKEGKGNGKYILLVPDIRLEPIKEITITVSDETHEIFKEALRVKLVPSPIAFFGDKDGGDITKEEIISTNSIKVMLKDFAFEGLEYTVSKFKFIYVHKKSSIALDGTGSELTQEMKSAMSAPEKGDMIIITDIYASFPGSAGDKRMPGAITLTVIN